MDPGIRKLRGRSRIDADGAAERVTAGIDGGVHQFGRSSGDINSSAGLAFFLAAGIDGARHRDAPFRTCAQEYPAITLGQRGGPDDAAIVDDARLKQAPALRREEDGPALRNDDALVRDKRLQDVAGDGDGEQAVSVQRKARHLPDREGDATETRLQAARIHDLTRGVQEDEAAILSPEMALIDDRTVTLVRETPFA